MALTFSDRLNTRMDLQPIDEASRIVMAVERVLKTPMGSYPFDPNFGVDITPYLGKFAVDVVDDLAEEARRAIDYIGINIEYEVSARIMQNYNYIIVISVVIHLGDDKYLVTVANDLRSLDLWNSTINIDSEFRQEIINQ